MGFLGVSLLIFGVSDGDLLYLLIGAVLTAVAGDRVETGQTDLHHLLRYGGW